MFRLNSLDGMQAVIRYLLDVRHDRLASRVIPCPFVALYRLPPCQERCGYLLIPRLGCLVLIDLYIPVELPFFAGIGLIRVFHGQVASSCLHVVEHECSTFVLEHKRHSLIVQIERQTAFVVLHERIVKIEDTIQVFSVDVRQHVTAVFADQQDICILGRVADVDRCAPQLGLRRFTRRVAVIIVVIVTNDLLVLACA